MVEWRQAVGLGAAHLAARDQAPILHLAGQPLASHQLCRDAWRLDTMPACLKRSRQPLKRVSWRLGTPRPLSAGAAPEAGLHDVPIDPQPLQLVCASLCVGRMVGAGQRALAGLLLLAALCCFPADGFRRADWTLANPGFEIEPYTYAGAVPAARSLALSTKSAPQGPWITYVSSMSFNPSAAMNVRRPQAACGGRGPRRRGVPLVPVCRSHAGSDPHLPPALHPADQRARGPERAWTGRLCAGRTPQARGWRAGFALMQGPLVPPMHPALRFRCRSSAQVIVAGLSAMPNGIAYNGGDLFIASLEPYKTCKVCNWAAE